MSSYQQIRHRPPTELAQPRSLVLVCPPLKSSVNFSRIVRAAGCFGVPRLVTCGRGTVDPEIVRDALDIVKIEVRRSMLPVLQKLKAEGYRLVGLEQSTDSHCLYDYSFARLTALVIGHERNGIDDSVLKVMDDVVEIPMYGRPLAHNVATAAAITMYEYCRQFPTG